jgi:hypothetical protein
MSSRYPKLYGKVGTIPMFIWFRSRKPYKVGDRVEFRTIENGRWETGIITNLEPLRLDRL